MRILREWWRNLRQQPLVESLAEELTKSRQQVNKLNEELHLLRLEVGDVKDRLDKARKEHAESCGNVNFLWRFIAARHRIDVPVERGTIREHLVSAESR